MIKVEKITKEFQMGETKLVALNKISFIVPKGQFLAITGMSGSGKSTLLYQLGLLDRPNEGLISINGINLTGMGGEKRTSFRLNSLGYIFQDYAILPTLTAKENVMLPLLMKGVKKQEASSKAEDALIKVGLKNRINNLPSQLSGGQQQRVSIARAISHNPQVLLADEPTANLDTESSENIMQIFSSLHKQGQTIILVTHEPEYASIAQRNIVLRDGSIIKDSLG